MHGQRWISEFNENSSKATVFRFYTQIENVCTSIAYLDCQEIVKLFYISLLITIVTPSFVPMWRRTCWAKIKSWPTRMAIEPIIPLRTEFVPSEAKFIQQSRSSFRSKSMLWSELYILCVSIVHASDRWSDRFVGTASMDVHAFWRRFAMHRRRLHQSQACSSNCSSWYSGMCRSLRSAFHKLIILTH